MPTVEDLAPIADHAVYFYDAVDGLVSVVTGPLATALDGGEAVVLIATEQHRAAFADGLARAGIDVDAAVADQRVVVRDAAATLEQLCVDGRPDPAAFELVVGAPLREAAARAHVRAYGEMVALLWEAGDVAGAMELEDLWNGLLREISCSLICAYPSAGEVDEYDTARVGVCSRHSHVVVGAPPAGAEVGRRFPCTPRSSRAARQFVADSLRDWDLATLVDHAILAVAELASNAVFHAGSDFTVGLSRREGFVRLIVGDANSDAPHVVGPGVRPLGGLGLHVVSRLSAGWGHEMVDGGKVVWVDLPSPTPATCAVTR